MAHTEWVIVRITERGQVRAMGDVTFSPWGQRILTDDVITGPSVDYDWFGHHGFVVGSHRSADGVVS